MPAGIALVMQAKDPANDYIFLIVILYLEIVLISKTWRAFT